MKISIKDFEKKLDNIAKEVPKVIKNVLANSAHHLTSVAKEKIGEYQPAIGRFKAWAALAESTEKEKERLGFQRGKPLLRTGSLKNSIKNTLQGNKATIGSDSKIMPYHEYGTSKIPPRNVFGASAFENEGKIAKAFGVAVSHYIKSGNPVDSIGYAKKELTKNG